MKTLIRSIVEELSADRPAALATVLRSKGSAPRGAGACQLLLQSGRAVGTVGGGVLEHRALSELQTLFPVYTFPTEAGVRAGASMSEPSPDNSDDNSVADLPPQYSYTQEYALTQNEVQSLGMVCGGNVTLVYQLLTPDLLPFFRAMEARLSENRAIWMVRRLMRGKVVAMALTDGHTPVWETSAAATDTLCARKPVWVISPDPAQSASLADADTLFSEPVSLPSHAYLFGGGHVAQSVAPLLAQLDFAPVVYDDRPEFANPSLFPTAAAVICAPFPEAGERLRVTSEDEIVIMTRGHANDLAILTQALRTPAYYIGLIGSRSKIAHTRSMLLTQGFTDADFSRVHTPIGLPIQAETPTEIAVSVAAEMILCRAQNADRVRTPEAP